MGSILAEKLGMPHATIIMEVQVDGSSLRVKRELEGGWFQWVAMPLPALLTIQSGINQLRYATLKGIMAAKKKEIRKASLPDGLQPSQQIAGLAVPTRSKQTQMITGSPRTPRKSWCAGSAKRRGRCDSRHRRTARGQAESRHVGNDRRRAAAGRRHADQDRRAWRAASDAAAQELAAAVAE